jgi:hypothetical protein
MSHPLESVRFSMECKESSSALTGSFAVVSGGEPEEGRGGDGGAWIREGMAEPG